MSFLSIQHAHKHFGSYHALRDVSFSVRKGQVTTLLGPSGCGKTTMLRTIAGLETLDEGLLSLDGRVLSGGGRSHVPPECRGIGMVFQSYALWPHKTVEENIALGLTLKGLRTEAIREKIDKVLGVVGLPGVAKRYPSSMSGGQQQRVSLARALALEPACLLFDEPLSNLDLVLRERMRFEIREILVRAGITAVYVTHDQSEAMVISDRVLIMEGGRIIQEGAPRDVYLRPVNRFVAEFLGGANLLPLDAATSQVRYGVFGGPGGLRLQGRPQDHVPEDGLIAFRPESVSLLADGTLAANVFPAVVESSVFLGTITQCQFRIGDVSINAALPGYRNVEPGQHLRLQIDPEGVTVVEESRGLAS